MEGMLIGAAVGGGTALLTGEDVLTGALIGAGTAGLTSGAQGLLGATNTAALTGVDTAVDAGVGVTAEAAKDAALTSQVASQQAMLQPTTTAIGGGNLYSTAANAGNLTNSGITGLGGMQAIPQTTQVASSGLGGLNAPVSQGGLSIGTATAGDAAQVAAKPGLMDRISTGYSNLTPMEKLGVGIGGTALLSSAMAPGVNMPEDEEYDGPLSKFKYNPNNFNPTRVVPNVYRPSYAQGGIAALAGGGYPMGRQDNTQFATPTQMPMSAEVVGADYEPVEMAVGGVSKFGMGQQGGGKTGLGQYGINNAGAIFNPVFGMMMNRIAEPKHNPLANFQPTRNANAARPAGSHVYKPQYAEGGIAGYNLGGYAAGGNPRLLKGPGDGMSDDIPATIANKQPARLADGEFVVPADVVSHLGNGSTDAGAKHLYKMMENVRKARTGKKAQGKQIKSEKFLPT